MDLELKILYIKSQILTSIESSPKFLIKTIKKFDNFKYLGGWISWNIFGKNMITRTNKIKLEFKQTKNTYKISLFRNSKFQH